LRASNGKAGLITAEIGPGIAEMNWKLGRRLDADLGRAIILVEGRAVPVTTVVTAFDLAEST
jgi:hypothetical protein